MTHPMTHSRFRKEADLRRLVDSGMEVLRKLKDRRKLKYMLPEDDCQMVPIGTIDHAIEVILASILVLNKDAPLTKAQFDYIEAVHEDMFQ